VRSLVCSHPCTCLCVRGVRHCAPRTPCASDGGFGAILVSCPVTDPARPQTAFECRLTPFPFPWARTTRIELAVSHNRRDPTHGHADTCKDRRVSFKKKRKRPPPYHAHTHIDRSPPILHPYVFQIPPTCPLNPPTHTHHLVASPPDKNNQSHAHHSRHASTQGKQFDGVIPVKLDTSGSPGHRSWRSLCVHDGPRVA
jgi:hypothetical protein